MLEEFLSNEIIPVIAFAGLLYLAVRALAFHDIRSIRGKDARPLKDEEHFARSAGYLLLFLSAVSLAMGLISFFIGPLYGLAEMVLGLVIFMGLWVRMNGKYGA